MITFLITIVILFLAYNLIPNIYYRNFLAKVIKKINTREKEIALTFDDGPDKRYTPELLDLLKKYKIKSTFFMVADKARENKSIVERTAAEGHAIGLHSRHHRSAWLSFPWQLRDDFNNSLEIFKKLNLEIRYYRPPWGTFNIFTYYFAFKNNLKTILWSLNTKDWSSRVTVEEITENIINNIEVGDIILFHDSYAAGTPARALLVLDKVIPLLLEKGYSFVRLPEVGDQE